ncbi:MAG: AAA family ATPase [Clostridiaceae bacterium]|nr:AAA family ATPase [Clostridiaceae bacterium]
MYIKRNVYQQLMDWKNESSNSTLEVRGARQVGKTYIINKFADENFKHKIYINLFELSGKQFLECYNRATAWMPGTPRPEHPLHDAFCLYDQSFEDTDDTVIIIDEIQESADIYNRIREFTRQFQCHFIVTGSYLGRVLEPEFRFSSGDVTSVTIYTLSFEEYLAAADIELFRMYLLIGNSVFEDKNYYEQLKQLYNIYCQIGGYPAVVEKYLSSGSLEIANKELRRIIETFLNESMRYFTDILDVSVFADIFLNICRILVREKKGLEQDSIGEELQKLVVKDSTSNVSKATVVRAINWLYHSGIIGFCGKIVELDILDFKPGRRCYFMDLGIANFYMTQAGLDKASINGTLNENYVYINLVKRLDFPQQIAFETPAFATYKNGEIDFYVQSLKERTRYVVEVKSGKQSGNTAKKALCDGKADYLLYLKGNTHGGVEGKIITRPIYALERFHF